MTFDASHTLRFVNTARAAMAMPILEVLPFAGTHRVDERGCVLARALHCEVGTGLGLRWRHEFVLRFADPDLAAAVGAATGQPCQDREVLAPVELANLATGFDNGWITARDAWYAHAGQLCFEDLALRMIPCTRPVAPAASRRAA